MNNEISFDGESCDIIKIDRKHEFMSIENDISETEEVDAYDRVEIPFAVRGPRAASR